MGRSTVGRSIDSLGCLKTNFKKLTNDQQYKPVSYIMIRNYFSVTAFLSSLSIIFLLSFVTVYKKTYKQTYKKSNEKNCC